MSDMTAFLDSGVMSTSYEDQGRSLIIYVNLGLLAHGPEEVRILQPNHIAVCVKAWER